MKAFKVPVIDVIRFGQENIVSTSPCWCHDCGDCTEGNYDCSCYDFNSNEPEGPA